ncbi:septum formation inhibitor Maf [Patescibacteria group bacterium]|nr:septum formation inhibitor Maf [Patescibacteria group bacterium]
MKRIILASTSPRRKELLSKTGLNFETQDSAYEEDMTLNLEPGELAKYLSKGKAQAVADKNRDAVVIGADTFITFEEKVLGKPHTPEKARETLQMLRGKSHTILTGFTIIENEKVVSNVVETKVHFRQLTDKEIDTYVASGEPLDKAGAYAIQGLGSELVDRIEGDYSNVVGLPVDDVMRVLEEFGVSPS